VAGKSRQLYLGIQYDGLTLRAIIDSGATDNFIDTRTARTNRLRLCKKTNPYPLVTVDGDTVRTDQGIVTHKTEVLPMTILKGHTKGVSFDLVAM
jgi:hypothetical protein